MRPSASTLWVGLELAHVARPVEHDLEQLARTRPAGQLGGQLVDEGQEALDAPDGGAFDAGLVVAAQGVDEGHPVAVGPGVQAGHGRIAHPPLGHVEDALDAHLVDRVGQHLQVGQGILDLAPVVEAGAPDHLVGDARAHELLFDDAALAVGPVEDGHVAPTVVVVVEMGDLVGHPLALVALVVGVVADDGLAVALVGPQLLGLAAQVVGDDGVGRVEDGLGGAVVLLQHDHGGVGESLLELQDVADVGAPEVVDAVVDQDTVGHIRVGLDDLEVVDRTVVTLELDGLDRGLDVAVASFHQHPHPRPKVAQRRVVVHRPVHGHPRVDVEGPRIRGQPSEGNRIGILLARRLEPEGAGKRSRPDREAGLRQAVRYLDPIG